MTADHVINLHVEAYQIYCCWKNSLARSEIVMLERDRRLLGVGRAHYASDSGINCVHQKVTAFGVVCLGSCALSMQHIILIVFLIEPLFKPLIKRRERFSLALELHLNLFIKEFLSGRRARLLLQSKATIE